jgi:hypothetical protein
MLSYIICQVLLKYNKIGAGGSILLFSKITIFMFFLQDNHFYVIFFVLSQPWHSQDRAD